MQGHRGGEAPAAVVVQGGAGCLGVKLGRPTKVHSPQAGPVGLVQPPQQTKPSNLTHSSKAAAAAAGPSAPPLSHPLLPSSCRLTTVAFEGSPTSTYPSSSTADSPCSGRRRAEGGGRIGSRRGLHTGTNPRLLARTRAGSKPCNAPWRLRCRRAMWCPCRPAVPAAGKRGCSTHKGQGGATVAGDATCSGPAAPPVAAASAGCCRCTPEAKRQAQAGPSRRTSQALVAGSTGAPSSTCGKRQRRGRRQAVRVAARTAEQALRHSSWTAPHCPMPKHRTSALVVASVVGRECAAWASWRSLASCGGQGCW